MHIPRSLLYFPLFSILSLPSLTICGNSSPSHNTAPLHPPLQPRQLTPSTRLYGTTTSNMPSIPKLGPSIKDEVTFIAGASSWRWQRTPNPRQSWCSNMSLLSMPRIPFFPKWQPKSNSPNTPLFLRSRIRTEPRTSRVAQQQEGV